MILLLQSGSSHFILRVFVAVLVKVGVLRVAACVAARRFAYDCWQPRLTGIVRETLLEEQFGFSALSAGQGCGRAGAQKD